MPKHDMLDHFRLTRDFMIRPVNINFLAMILIIDEMIEIKGMRRLRDKLSRKLSRPRQEILIKVCIFSRTTTLREVSHCRAGLRSGQNIHALIRNYVCTVPF